MEKDLEFEISHLGSTYNVIVFRPKTLKFYEKIDFTQIHFLINSIWFIFYVYKQRSFETPKQILIVPNNDIYLHIVMIFYRPKLPTWSLINQFNFTKDLIWSCICILGVSRIIRFVLIWFDLIWFNLIWLSALRCNMIIRGAQSLDFQINFDGRLMYILYHYTSVSVWIFKKNKNRKQKYSLNLLGLVADTATNTVKKFPWNHCVETSIGAVIDFILWGVEIC